MMTNTAHRGLPRHIRSHSQWPYRHRQAGNASAGSAGPRGGRQYRQGSASNPGSAHRTRQSFEAEALMTSGRANGCEIRVSSLRGPAGGLCPRGRRHADHSRPARRLRLRVRIPDGLQQCPLAPRHRDGLPDGVRDQSVHLVAFRQRDPPLWRRRLQLHLGQCSIAKAVRTLDRVRGPRFGVPTPSEYRPHRVPTDRRLIFGPPPAIMKQDTKQGRRSGWI